MLDTGNFPLSVSFPGGRAVHPLKEREARDRSFGPESLQEHSYSPTSNTNSLNCKEKKAQSEDPGYGPVITTHDIYHSNGEEPSRDP